MYSIRTTTIALFFALFNGALSSTYIGCFIDTNDRDLPEIFWLDELMTVEKCVKYCKDNDYQFAGLQQYTSCRCGNKYGDYGKVDDSECSTSCKGNREWQMCGGLSRNSVYSTSNYVGCYIDGSGRDLNGISVIQEPQITIEFCLNFCRDNGFAFAGVQLSDQCYCGVEFGAYGKASEIDCSTPCAANELQMCGGEYRNSIYSTAISESLPDSNWFALSNGYQYRIVRSLNTWHQSEAICASYGAILASKGLRDETTREYLKEIVDCEDRLWIGLNDMAVEGEWVWSDGKISTASNTDWYPGEPNNGNAGEYENCGEIATRWSFQVNDVECVYLSYALCEKQT